MYVRGDLSIAREIIVWIKGDVIFQYTEQLGILKHWYARKIWLRCSELI